MTFFVPEVPDRNYVTVIIRDHGSQEDKSAHQVNAGAGQIRMCPYLRGGKNAENGKKVKWRGVKKVGRKIKRGSMEEDGSVGEKIGSVRVSERGIPETDYRASSEGLCLFVCSFVCVFVRVTGGGHNQKRGIGIRTEWETVGRNERVKARSFSLQ